MLYQTARSGKEAVVICQRKSAYMANKKFHPLVYQRKTGRTTVKIKGPSSAVMTLVWFDRLTTFFSALAIGLVWGIDHWRGFSLIFQWLIQKVKSW
jgi:hypothetical protein